MAGSSENLVIVLFPYLFTHESEEIDLGEYKLYPSHKVFFDKQSSQVRAHLDNLARSFAYGQYEHINQYLFGHFKVKNKNDWNKLKRVLDTFSTIAAFSELSSERSGASYSNFNYAVFEIVRPIEERDYYFYDGSLNGSSPISIHFNQKKKKPETSFRPNIQIRPHILEISDYLKKLMDHLYWHSMYISLDERKRILRAISWFNKSHRLDPEIDNFERLISLSVALESLFNASKRGVRSQLLTGITILLGESSEMSEWLDAFYDKRSRIIHGQEEQDTLYQEKKSSSAHINHIAYAREVFARCVKFLIESRSQSYVKDLHEKLISNERRLNEIKKALDKTENITRLKEQRVFSTITSLTNRDVTGSANKAVLIGNKLLKLLDTKMIKGDTRVLENIISEIRGFKGTKYADLATHYSGFGSAFRQFYFNDDKVKASKLSLEFRAALYTFSGYMSWRLFNEAFKKKKKAK